MHVVRGGGLLRILQRHTQEVVLRQIHGHAELHLLEAEDTQTTLSVFWVRPHTRGYPSRCF
jgi:hypothetical protein